MTSIHWFDPKDGSPRNSARSREGETLVVEFIDAKLCIKPFARAGKGSLTQNRRNIRGGKSEREKRTERSHWAS